MTEFIVFKTLGPVCSRAVLVGPKSWPEDRLFWFSLGDLMWGPLLRMQAVQSPIRCDALLAADVMQTAPTAIHMLTVNPRPSVSSSITAGQNGDLIKVRLLVFSSRCA